MIDTLSGRNFQLLLISMKQILFIHIYMTIACCCFLLFFLEGASFFYRVIFVYSFFFKLNFIYFTLIEIKLKQLINLRDLSLIVTEGDQGVCLIACLTESFMAWQNRNKTFCSNNTLIQKKTA